MKVRSTVYPESREYLQGKVLVNFNVTSEEEKDGTVMYTEEEKDGTVMYTEKEKDGTVMYTYEQLRFEPWYSDEAIEKEVDKRKEELKVKSITPRQIRLQLNALGLRQQVEDWVATQPFDIKDWWEFSSSYERNNQLLIDAATHFGFTSEQLDELFMEASKL